MSFTEDYIATYNSRDIDRFVAQFAPNGCYTDVTMKLTYADPDEIRRMYTSVIGHYQDWEFTHLRGVSNDRYYAIEWSFTAVATEDGKEYTVRAASLGDLDDQGRILENRDYWNPAHWPSGDEDLHVEADAFAQHTQL